MQQWEADLEVGDAERRAQHVLLLLGERVRRVVGADRVHAPVQQPGPERLYVRLPPERRGYLEQRVVAGQRLVREGEVVRRDLQGDGRAGRLEPTAHP